MSFPFLALLTNTCPCHGPASLLFRSNLPIPVRFLTGQEILWKGGAWDSGISGRWRTKVGQDRREGGTEEERAARRPEEEAAVSSNGPRLACTMRPVGFSCLFLMSILGLGLICPPSSSRRDGDACNHKYNAPRPVFRYSALLLHSHTNISLISLINIRRSGSSASPYPFYITPSFPRPS